MTNPPTRGMEDREERFRRIADSMPQLMWTTDESGHADWCNERWHRYTGRSASETLRDGWLDALHPEDVVAVRERWQRSLALLAPVEYEARLRGGDGGYRWFLTRAVCVRATDATPTKWYASATDINDERRAARAMRVFADIGEAMTKAPGLHATLRAIMHGIVPEYADWAFISLIGEDGLARVEATHPGRKKGSRAARASLEIPIVVGAQRRGSLTMCMASDLRRFDPLDMPFFAELTRRIAPAIANAEMFERERRVAMSFQSAALPASLPVAEGIEFDAVYEAGKSESLVGGDWYDAFRLPDGRFVISIGDVTGSGLPAAVMMSNIRQTIRGIANVRADPGLMLESADRTLRGEHESAYATAFVGVVDPLTRTLTYQSAGHPPPLLLLDGTCTELQWGGVPLGLQEHHRGETHAINLPNDSLLVLYTDGLTESTHDLIDGERRLREALISSKVARAARPAKALHEEVLHGGARDDVAILAVRVVRWPEILHWRLDTHDEAGTNRMRADILTHLHDRGSSETLEAKAEIVLNEVIGNIARYTDGRADISLEWTEHHPVFHIRDNGPGFEFVPRLPNDVYSESGRGLFLIAAYAHDFHVLRRPEGGSHARIVLGK
jgi:PAS domain S-box-containing protein